jgi:hypothetical protein
MRRLCVPLVLIALVPATAWACAIPVFRFALERWELAPYEVVVFHQETAPERREAGRRALEQAARQLNARPAYVDVSRPMTPAHAKLWQRQEPQKSLPWLVVRSSEAEAKQPDAWAGPFSDAALGQVADSPARRQLVKHLSAGASAVFLLLESGDAKKDQAAADLLDAELPRLAKLIKLPEPDAAGPQLLTKLPLRVEFAALRLNRTTPAEQAFVQMLLSSDAEIGRVRGPIVIPVFGRGRMLCSLFGEDLGQKQLEGVARFLCGKCSCDVKELNPGVDLLLSANWPELLDQGRGER